MSRSSFHPLLSNCIVTPTTLELLFMRYDDDDATTADSLSLNIIVVGGHNIQWMMLSGGGEIPEWSWSAAVLWVC